MSAAFELRGLTAAVPGEKAAIRLVEDVSLHVHAGETLAVVGESGSGKTVTFTSALGLLPKPGRVIAGQALLEGVDLLTLGPEALRRMRGARIGMVFQDPLTGLNPVFRVGAQIAEVLRAHLPLSRQAARDRAVELLARVQIPDPARRVDDYPHQFSGGMRQRVLTAMAIALGPRVLIADEPTTALDVTVQAQVLDLLGDLRDADGMAMVLITHDLGVVARQADRVAVMYAGRVVETGTVAEVFAAPRHPYTIALFRSIPDIEAPPGTQLAPIAGSPPEPARRPAGCAFAPRCFAASEAAGCHATRPPLTGTGHAAACHRQGALEIAA
ncbi:ABC transporter ATP-binding protein [Roseococcus suduntuyensis]|uniref:Oligopeptide transport system ATP-binding protein n=1 Tax=Roseococcus suduntuyensis TaxID=455361 RepID=A0A840A656_9PROT|nr:ABC transporter ATP-binding protein [Roseococcus suduntuyensis]MBB3896721.1 oligopeptide transport system ATP-binding protein [Roseococcus suduntuyensis]